MCDVLYIFIFIRQLFFAMQDQYLLLQKDTAKTLQTIYAIRNMTDEIVANVSLIRKDAQDAFEYMNKAVGALQNIQNIILINVVASVLTLLLSFALFVRMGCSNHGTKRKFQPSDSV